MTPPVFWFEESEAAAPKCHKKLYGGVPPVAKPMKKTDYPSVILTSFFGDIILASNTSKLLLLLQAPPAPMTVINPKATADNRQI
jgi:hypothetical protein